MHLLTIQTMYRPIVELYSSHTCFPPKSIKKTIEIEAKLALLGMIIYALIKI